MKKKKENKSHQKNGANNSQANILSLNELNSRFELWEHNAVKYKFKELDDIISETDTSFKWLLGALGACIVFLSTNLSIVFNYFELQFLILIFYAFYIITIFSLETKFLFLCQEKQKLYNALKENSLEELNAILFTSYSYNHTINFSVFPRSTFFIIFTASFYTVLLRFFDFNTTDFTSYNLYEKIITLLTYHNEFMLNFIAILPLLICISYLLVFYIRKIAR